MEKKKLVEVLVAICVGVLFLSSYANFAGSNGIGAPKVNATTTAIVPQTVYAYGFANAMILNYSENLQVGVSCSNSTAVLGIIENITSALESNNLVINTYSTGRTVLVQVGNIGARGFYKYVSSRLNQSTLLCTSFAGTADVELPQSINFTVSGTTKQSFPAQLSASMRSNQVPINLSYNGSSIRMKIAALLEANGTVYQLNVTSDG